jgi:hypothetical protein
MSDHRAEMKALTKEHKQISVRETAVTVSVSYGSKFARVLDDVKNAVHMWL